MCGITPFEMHCLRIIVPEIFADFHSLCVADSVYNITYDINYVTLQYVGLSIHQGGVVLCSVHPGRFTEAYHIQGGPKSKPLRNYE